MATLKSIAQEAGVSVDTVSRVLNGKNKELWASSAARAAVIRAIAERLNYRPNSSARSVRTGKFGCFTLLLSTETSHSMLFETLLSGILDALASGDLHLNVAKLPDEKLMNEGFVPKILRQLMSDGMLINYQSYIPQRMIELVRQYNIPSVWINSRHASDCVYPDDRAGGRLAAEYLLQLGHQRIVYAEFLYHHVGDAGTPNHHSAGDRYNGYAETLCAANLRPAWYSLKRPLAPEEAMAYAREWLAPASRPTAVVCYCGYEAFQVAHAATSLGLRIPQDLSVVSFDERPREVQGQSVTTIVPPWLEIGAAAVQMLQDKLANPAPLNPRVLAPSLVCGQSTLPPQEN